MSNPVYKDQTLLTIRLTPDYDLTTVDSVKIYYKKPISKTVGSWVGTIDGDKISYQVIDGDIDEAGKWAFQSAVIVDSKEARGKIVTQTIDTPIQ